MTTVTETRDALAEDITRTNHRAKRDYPKVGDTEHPTPWDIHHVRLNVLLDQLEAAANGQAPTPNA